jgi:hypothetical protein
MISSHASVLNQEVGPQREGSSVEVEQSQGRPHKLMCEKGSNSYRNSTVQRIVFKHVHDLNLFNLPTEQLPSSRFHDSKLSYSFFGKHQYPLAIVELSILAEL